MRKGLAVKNSTWNHFGSKCEACVMVKLRFVSSTNCTVYSRRIDNVLNGWRTDCNDRMGNFAVLLHFHVGLDPLSVHWWMLSSVVFAWLWSSTSLVMNSEGKTGSRRGHWGDWWCATTYGSTRLDRRPQRQSWAKKWSEQGQTEA